MDFGGQQQGFIHVPLSKEEEKEIKVYVWDSTAFWKTEENKEKRKGGDNKENSDKQKD